MKVKTVLQNSPNLPQNATFLLRSPVLLSILAPLSTATSKVFVLLSLCYRLCRPLQYRTCMCPYVSQYQEILVHLFFQKCFHLMFPAVYLSTQIHIFPKSPQSTGSQQSIMTVEVFTVRKHLTSSSSSSSSSSLALLLLLLLLFINIVTIIIDCFYYYFVSYRSQCFV